MKGKTPETAIAQAFASPPPPEHLDLEARAEWDRVAQTMLAAGIDASLYRAPLAIYAVAWSRWVRAEQQVAATGGEVVKSPSGFPIQNPWLAIAHQAQAQMQSIMRKFR